jgi:predicted nucleic acid-binding protein
MTDIFIDADIILDLLLRREPYFSPAARLFTLLEQKKLQAYTTPVVLVNIYYIAAKIVKRERAIDYIRQLLTILHLAAVDEKIMLLAANSGFSDFEDAIQYHTAKSRGVEYLLTRNKADYKVTDITVCTPEEFLRVYWEEE